MSLRIAPLGGALATFVLVSPAWADDKAATFEQLLASAEPVADVPALVDSLGRACAHDDDGEKRRCEQVRRHHKKRVATTRLHAIAEPAAVRHEAPTDKGVRVAVRGCLRCSGKPAVTSGDKGIPEVGQKLLPVGADDFEQWKKGVAPYLRVQYVFTMAAEAAGGAYRFTPLGWRLFDRCSGEVLASSPPSAEPAPVLSEGCPQAPKAAAHEDPTPDRLTPGQIMEAMAPVAEATKGCAKEHRLSGTLVARITPSTDGSIRNVEWMGPLAGSGETPSPARACIEPVLSKVKFPAFRHTMPPFDYPIMFKLEAPKPPAKPEGKVDGKPAPKSDPKPAAKPEPKAKK